jgi:RNA polymerase sigma-70 factor (ECF subfamily)
VELDEGALCVAARRGELAAYEELARRHQALAFRAAYLITRDAAEAEDALQDALLKAHAALPTLRPDAPFRPWLLRIVTNEALNRRRAAGRRAGLALRLGALAVGDAPSPEAALLAREERELVIAQLNTLAEPDRVVIAYRYLLDLPIADIAVALDCPENTVRTRLSRALGRLRERVVAALTDAAPAPEPSHE